MQTFNATVSNKTIDTRDIRLALVEGEDSFTTITFALDASLTGLKWRVRGVNAAGGAAESDEITPTESASAVTVAWLVKNPFTACAGPMQLTLVGYNSNQTEVVKALGLIDIPADASMAPHEVITESLYEQLIGNVQAAVAEASDSADAAAASETAAEAAQQAAETAQTAAEQSATDAGESATASAESAETASGSANAAASSATTAGTKATEAAASATLAGQKATAAAASATAAQNSATSAAGYAERAEDAAESVENPAKATDLTDTHFGKAMQMEVADIPYNLGMTQYGQCVQDGTPTPTVPVPITYPNAGASVYGKNLLPLLAQSYTANGITITRNADSYTFNGSATGLTFNNYDNNLGFLRKGQTYSITMKSDKHSGNIAFQIFTANSDGRIIAYLVNLKADLETRVLTFSTPDTPDVARISARAYVDNGETVSSETITIQIEHGSTATAYEPYKTPISIVVKDTNNADVPLYGIPVASNGNVTIGGQQYIADTLVDNGDGTGTANRRVKVVDAGTMAWAYYAAGSYFYSNSLTDKKGGGDNLLCTAYARGSSNGCMRGVANANTVVAYNTDYTDADAFKAAMSGVLIYYELETHITETVAITYSDTPTAISPIATWLSDAYSAVKTGVYQALKSAYAEINLLRSMMTI